MTWRKPMPSDARMVFKGVIFEVWQWEQTIYDGSAVVFERLRRSDAAQVILVVDGMILLQEQYQPDTDRFLSLPGGRCEPDETPLQSAQRELIEESGYESDEWELFQTDEPTGKIEWKNYTFIARGGGKKQDTALDAGEKITHRWITFDDFLMLSDDPLFRSNSLIPTLLRARLDPQKREDLKKRLGIA